MTIELPAPIAAYFQADRERDADAIAACFTSDAVVKDEGKTYSGREEIRQWQSESSAKYTYTSKPFAITGEHGRTVVTSHLIGNFPGSPVDLRYIFVIAEDKVADLEIIP